MKVHETMTREVRITSPDATIQQAAQTMADLDAGALPVGEKDHLVGMITDRDIAIRGVAEGRGPNTKVRDLMTAEIKYCFDDQDIEEVARNMGDIKVRRLPVVDRKKRLVGILSIGDIAVTGGAAQVGQALGGISRPGGAHCQAN
jgi:CBS domain-containing protein